MLELVKIGDGKTLPGDLERVMRRIVEQVYAIELTPDIPPENLWDTPPGGFLKEKKLLFFLLNCCDRSLMFIYLAKLAGYDGNLVVIESRAKDGSPIFHCGVEITVPGSVLRMFFDPLHSTIAVVGHGLMDRHHPEKTQVHRILFGEIDESTTTRMVMKKVMPQELETIFLGANNERISLNVRMQKWEALLCALGEGDIVRGQARLLQPQFRVPKEELREDSY